MIRRLVITAFAASAMLGATDIAAQTIGFKLGGSFANWNIDGTGAPATDPLSSLMGGGFVRFGMGPIAFQPELLVTTRGAAVAGTGKVKVEYLEVPVLAVLPFPLASGINPYLMAGPDVAFEIGCELDEAPADEDFVECHHQIESTGRKRTDVGVTVGAGLELPFGPGALLIEGRYNLGLLNMSQDSDVAIKSRTPAVLAGYPIALTR